MIDKINELCIDIENLIIEYRRDFHKHAESGWNEYRTASRIAQRLYELGYEVKVGRETVDETSRMGLPEKEVQEHQYQRALAQGAVETWAKQMTYGFTGVVGTLSNGPGPVIGYRFDIDAVELNESENPAHLPNKEGFASINSEAMHACGHDGHTAIGLGLAEILSKLKTDLRGTVKLIFQPAEEGVRGAKSMTAAGVVDDVDELYGLHIGFKAKKSGELFCGTQGFLATSKFDAFFHGSPAHAGYIPHQGRNALLSAATAIINLSSIPRHGEGATRINVGKITGGSGRNVIPAHAHLVIETRGENSDLNGYMKNYAIRVLESSAKMHDTTVDIVDMGDAESGESDLELMEKLHSIADSSNLFTQVHETRISLGGSDDFTHLMRRVQSRGGTSTYMMLGSNLKDNHHTAEFDFNEKDLINGVKILALTALM